MVSFVAQLLKIRNLIDEMEKYANDLDSNESRWLRDGIGALCVRIDVLLTFCRGEQSDSEASSFAADVPSALMLSEGTARRVNAFATEAVAIVGDDFEVARLSLASNEQKKFTKLVGYYLGTIYFQFNEPIWSQYPDLIPANVREEASKS